MRFSLKDFMLVLTTVPDEKVGEKIAQRLLKERLAACVTISSASSSFFWWQEKIAKEKEHILFIKTKSALFPELEGILKDNHPYDVPEIIALPLLEGSPEYLDWIKNETKS